MLIQNAIPICLAGFAAAAAAAAVPVDSTPTNLTSCNKADIALVKFNTRSQPGLCKIWLNGARQTSLVQGMTSDELTSACDCILTASQEMKLALQQPVVRVVKTTPKAAANPPIPKTTAKTTPKTTAKTTAPVVKTTPKVSVKTTSSSSSKKSSSTTSSKAVSVKSSSSSAKVSSKSGTSKSSSISSSSSQRCIGIACSKSTAKTSSTTSAKTSASVKSSTKSLISGSKSSSSASKSGSQASPAGSASRSGSKVSTATKSGSSVSITGATGKGLSTNKSSSSKAKPTSDPSAGGGDSGTGSDGSDTGSGSDSGSPAPTPSGDDGSVTKPSGDDVSAATTPAEDDGSSTYTQSADDGSAVTTPTDDGSSATSTSAIPTSAPTSTKPRSVTVPATIKSSTNVSPVLTRSTKSILSASLPSTSSTTSSSTSAVLPVVKPSPICTSPIAANETFQLYISGTNSAIDNTPMQGLTNGATAVGFSVGYATLNFTLDCTTGYVYWGSGAVLSGNKQAFSVKSQSVVVAPIGDSNNSPLSCSLDTNFVMTCQYTSSRSPTAFQGWAVSTGDARYLAMSQSNTTGITLKAVPLKSNLAITYPTHATNQNLLKNGEFAASSTSPWSKFTQGKSSDVTFNAPPVNASQSCYAFAGMLSIAPSQNFLNGYAWGGISQPGVTLYMGEQLFVGYDVFLNYPTGLPSGVRCDIQVKGTEHDTLSYVRYDNSSPAFVSFNTITTASYNGTGSFSITAYCQGQPGGPWPNLNIGFNNVRLLAAYDPTGAGAALSCGFKNARDTIQSATLQPYCSSLFSYSTPTITVTSMISTTTTSTVTVSQVGRRRNIITAAAVSVPDTLWPRQLDVPADASMQTSSMIGGVPSALATFAPQDVTNACSVEATAVSTTVTETSSPTTTITAYSTTTKVSGCQSTPLTNGNFEGGNFDSWYKYDPINGQGGSWTIEPGQDSSRGSYVAQITMQNPGGVGGFAGYLQQTVGTCRGVTYTLSYDYQCLGVTYATPQAAIWASSGNVWGPTQSCTGGPSGWQTVSLTYVSQGGSVQPSIWMVQNGPRSDRGVIQIDNVQFTAGAPSCTNGAVNNSDFTNGLTSWNSASQSGTVSLNADAAQLYCNAQNTGPYDRSAVTQTVSTCPGTQYSVSWRYYIPAINGNEDTYIYLYTGDSVKSENIISATSSHNGEEVDGNNQPIGTWYTQTATFTANDKSTLIGVEAVCCNYNEFTILIDDVTVNVAS